MSTTSAIPPRTESLIARWLVDVITHKAYSLPLVLGNTTLTLDVNKGLVSISKDGTDTVSPIEAILPSADPSHDRIILGYCSQRPDRVSYFHLSDDSTDDLYITDGGVYHNDSVTVFTAKGLQEYSLIGSDYFASVKICGKSIPFNEVARVIGELQSEDAIDFYGLVIEKYKSCYIFRSNTRAEIYRKNLTKLVRHYTIPSTLTFTDEQQAELREILGGEIPDDLFSSPRQDVGVRKLCEKRGTALNWVLRTIITDAELASL